MNGRNLIVLLAILAAAAGGWFAAGLRSANEQTSVAAGEAPLDGPCPGGEAPLYWVAPMDADFIRNEPGLSPMGMDLVPKCRDGGVTEGAESTAGIRIDSNILQNLGVRSEEVERRDLARVVRAAGRVDYDERRVAHVHIKVQGWVERLYVDYAGQTVEEGQPLLDIYSPELVSTQEELLIALRYRDEALRSQNADVISGAESMLAAVQQRLDFWDISQQDISQLVETGVARKTLTLYAPTGGAITELNVRHGMEVGPSTNLYTIADLSQVWVYATIHEYELPWVEPGYAAVITIRSAPNQRFEGRVSYIYPFLDPITHTARVRIDQPNSSGLLKPEMIANVRIETSPREQVLAIPEEALIRTGKREVVIIDRGGGTFEPREVSIGLETGEGWIEIVDGLDERDRVVTSGQFLLDSESKFREAARKFLAESAEK